MVASETWRRDQMALIDKHANRSGIPSGLSIAAGNGRGPSGVHRAAMASRTDEPTSSSASPHGIGAREAELLLGMLARVKARRFGRLIVTVNDGRVVDVEVIEKIDREVLRTLSM